MPSAALWILTLPLLVVLALLGASATVGAVVLIAWFGLGYLALNRETRRR